uniref:Uncharacterized protein n=1 Tax=Oryza sativa subsp. japonica TaxID=39947 RepID=Q6H451_ORYSJ|nr:hypothetical protein [Oryza sativa Japonica Group]BAD26498.1 hypothetical protein [Oryza sativa Japonica Group]
MASGAQRPDLACRAATALPPPSLLPVVTESSPSPDLRHCRASTAAVAAASTAAVVAASTAAVVAASCSSSGSTSRGTKEREGRGVKGEFGAGAPGMTPTEKWTAVARGTD